MSVLLVDIGNTRVKWALLRGTGLSRMHALAHDGKSSAMRTVVRAAPRGVLRVKAVCVAGAPFERTLRSAVRARFGITVEFVRSTRGAAGVRNGYRDTWRLGADRWVSVIAAHAMAKTRPAIVANIGTALTIDAVTGDGLHLGGLIAPGPDTMIDSLLEGTHGIRRRAHGGGAEGARPRRWFERDTATALATGAHQAAATLIDGAAAAARETLGHRPLLLLTGGAAPRVRPFMKNAGRVQPDLVLRGLGVLARGK